MRPAKTPKGGKTPKPRRRKDTESVHFEEDNKDELKFATPSDKKVIKDTPRKKKGRALKSKKEAPASGQQDPQPSDEAEVVSAAKKTVETKQQKDVDDDDDALLSLALTKLNAKLDHFSAVYKAKSQSLSLDAGLSPQEFSFINHQSLKTKGVHGNLLKTNTQTHMDAAKHFENEKLDALMKKAVDLNGKKMIGGFKESQRNKQKRRDKPEVKTTGKQWFNMPEAVITPEVKKDLEALRLRGALDKTRHYKKAEKSDSRFFQMGTVVESAADFYSSRLSRKERKQSLFGELMDNDDTKKYMKRKFTEIQGEKSAGGKKYYKEKVKKRQKRTK